MYTDNILIRLEREYSKDEMVIFAMNTIRELKQRNEKLSSEINKVRIENKALLYQRIKDSELKKKVINSMGVGVKMTKEDKEIFLKDKYVEGLLRGNNLLKKQNKRYRETLKKYNLK